MFIVTHARDRRRELVSTLAELLNEKPRYCYAPSFAFAFSQCTVDRDAVIHPSENAEQQAVIDLAALLNRRGFECVVRDIAADAPESAGHYTVRVERGKISEGKGAGLLRSLRFLLSVSYHRIPANIYYLLLSSLSRWRIFSTFLSA